MFPHIVDSVFEQSRGAKNTWFSCAKYFFRIFLIIFRRCVPHPVLKFCEHRSHPLLCFPIEDIKRQLTAIIVRVTWAFSKGYMDNSAWVESWILGRVPKCYPKIFFKNTLHRKIRYFLLLCFAQHYNTQRFCAVNWFNKLWPFSRSLKGEVCDIYYFIPVLLNVEWKFLSFTQWMCYTIGTPQVIVLFGNSLFAKNFLVFPF